MFKKLFPLLTLSVFITINSAQPPTGAVTKITAILNKMGVVNTTSSTEDYTEVSPDARINTYNTDHELINSTQVPERIKNLLNKPNASKNEQIEAEFFLYRLATRLKIEQAPNKTSISTTIKKVFSPAFNVFMILRFTSFAFGQNTISGWMDKIQPDFMPSNSGEGCSPMRKTITTICTQLMIVNFTDIVCKNPIYGWFDRRRKKQDEEELNKKTLCNFGLYADTDYSFLLKKMQPPLLKKVSEKEDTDCSFLLKKMQPPLLKKAFERGIKERKNRSRRS